MKYISYYLFFWVLCLFSLNVWGQATRINFSNISVIDGLSQSSAFAIAQDSLGYMWFGTFDGLNRYSGYEIQTFKHSDNDSLSLPDNYIQALCVDCSGQLWIGTNSHGICLFDYASEQFIPLSSCAQTSADFQSSSVFTLRIFNDTTIVALTDLGIYFINTHTKNQRRIGSAAYKSLPDAPSLVSYFNPQITDSLTIHTFFVDSKGDKWMGTNVGLWRKIVGRSTWLRYSQNVCYEGAITSNDITCVFEDRGGVLWVGTSLGGVCFWNRINEKVLLYRNSPLDPEGLHGTQIRCFYEDSDEKIWIGTVECGINIWDTKNDIFEHWNVDNNVGLRNNHIRDIDFWNGRYIIATDGSGLQSCTYSDGELQCRDFYEDIIPQNARIWDVYSNDSSLWVGSYSHGLFVITKDTVYSFYSIIGSSKVSWIVADEENTMWIGTFGNGIFRYSPSMKLWEHIHSQNSALRDDRIYAIVPDSYGTVWIGTKGGLHAYTLNNQSITAYTTEHGLPNNTVMGIVLYKDSSLWVTTNNGVSHLFLNTQEIINYSVRDGLQDNEFLAHSFLQLASGDMLWGGVNGFNMYPWDEPENYSYKPQIVFTRLFVNNACVKTDSALSITKQINLQYTENDFTFEFAALSYANSKSNIYSYILEGFDEKWKFSENRRFAQYTNVPPGKYIFKVKAANNQGTWNPNASEIHVQVHPAFWQTTFFSIIVFVCIILFIYLVFRIRMYQIRKNEITLKKEVKRRTKELRQQKKQLENTLATLKETQNQLIQSEKMASVGVLVSGIAHEINNPINFVSAGVASMIHDVNDIHPLLEYVRKLKEASEITEKNLRGLFEKYTEYDVEAAFVAIRETIGDIQMGTNRITEIVSGLRRFSRVESDVWQTVNIHDEIENVLILLKNKYKHTIRIEKQYGKSVPQIECYPGKVNQVIMNIISNAIDSIGSHKGTIIITTSHTHTNVMISIKDTGIGMSRGVQAKIFDPFFTTKDVGKGVGLGLSISYTIIQEHAGRIIVNSEKNVGSEFIIELPISQKKS